jgi:hypothetical protein
MLLSGSVNADTITMSDDTPRHAVTPGQLPAVLGRLLIAAVVAVGPIGLVVSGGTIGLSTEDPSATRSVCQDFGASPLSP